MTNSLSDPKTMLDTIKRQVKRLRKQVEDKGMPRVEIAYFKIKDLPALLKFPPTGSRVTYEGRPGEVKGYFAADGGLIVCQIKLDGVRTPILVGDLWNVEKAK